MSQRLYDSATAEALMKFAYPEYRELDLKPYEIRENGVYATEAFRDVCQPGTIFNWTPADDMGWPGSPNPDTAPFLPIPFDAKQLAAAMIDGAGQSIAYAMEHRLGYPLNDDALNKFPDRMRWMRDALTEAYAVAAAAQSVVGEFDHDQQARAHAMAQQFEEANEHANDREGVFEQGITSNEASARRARALASVADLNAQAERAQTAVVEKWKAWRKAMVRQLLRADSRRSYIARRLEEMKNEENKKLELVADAAFERREAAQLKLERREAILNSPETLCVPIAVAEADVEIAKREVAEAERNIRVRRGDFPDTMKEPESEAEQQFWFQNAFLDLEHWAALTDVSAREAAMLLCLHNPRKISFEDAKTTPHQDLPDWHLEHLDRRLAVYAAQESRPCRSLLDWYSAAQGMQIKLPPEAVSFMEYVAKQSNVTPVPVAHGVSNAPAHDDFSMLATREQLIEAFGRFTGMDASWFKNIKDTPALLSARKVAGQGGRGHIAEPLFCPFEVMQWLTSHKRRKNKGRKLSAEKAWELLEKNFPKVHSARSVADPRTGD